MDKPGCRSEMGGDCCSVEESCVGFFFFFQAEDGIRDLTVTGVQTCALPISRLIGVHCSEQRSTLLRPQQVPWPHSPTGISGRLAAGLAKGDAMRIFKKGPAIPEFFPYQALVLLCLFSLAYTVTAQTLTTGQVLGRLTDPSGATVPQARIELRDTATGSVRATTTDEAGQYTFSQVTPGSYSVTAIAAGFAHAVVSSVTVEVGKSSTINIELSLGKTTETIEVHSPPGADLQTLDSTVGNTVSREELLALPSIDRSTTSLLLLQPFAMPPHSTSTSQASRFGGQVAGVRRA